LLVFLGGGPVDQSAGEILPIFALGAVVVDTVAFDFIFSDELIGAVFEDEAVNGVLLVGERGECEHQDKERAWQSSRREILGDDSQHCFLPLIINLSPGRVESARARQLRSNPHPAAA
jgi:hypothetical protein